ncbi:MAG: hypothetical protein IAE96_04990 [Chitinophagaceae bacterium]|nr:hypothetical protein [Chitinophagaceae bacterium]
MAKEIVIPESQLPEKFLEAVQLLQKLRHFKRVWDTQYGAHNRNNLRRWEDKADEFLTSLTIEEIPDINDTGKDLPLQ